MSDLKDRLFTYAAAAAVIPAGAASGAVVWSGPGPVGIATSGSPMLLDLGPGIGEVFRFEVRASKGTTTFDATSFSTTYGTHFYPGGTAKFSFNNALFQFNPANSGNVGDPRFMNGGGGGNDPARLLFGAPISAGQYFFGPMTTSFSTSHDLAESYRSTGMYTTGAPLSHDGGFGGWFHGNRGYIGFNIEVGGADTFGWIDVEWIPEGVTRSEGSQLIIHGWAYNDTPRGPITAGEIPAPASVGLAALAMGAAGVRRQRRIA